MNSKKLTRLAAIIAVIVVAYAIDITVSNMTLLGINIRTALTTLAVTITVCLLFDLKTALFAATVFGLVSMCVAYIIPSPTAPQFQKPHISVLPRMVIGFTSYGTFKLIRKLTANSKNTFAKNTLPSSAAAVVGVLTNTILVLTMLSLERGDDAMRTIVSAVIATNFIIEFVGSIILVPVLVKAVNASVIKPSGGR